MNKIHSSYIDFHLLLRKYVEFWFIYKFSILYLKQQNEQRKTSETEMTEIIEDMNVNDILLFNTLYILKSSFIIYMLGKIDVCALIFEIEGFLVVIYERTDSHIYIFGFQCGYHHIYQNLY